MADEKSSPTHKKLHLGAVIYLSLLPSSPLDCLPSFLWWFSEIESAMDRGISADKDVRRHLMTSSSVDSRGL